MVQASSRIPTAVALPRQGQRDGDEHSAVTGTPSEVAGAQCRWQFSCFGESPRLGCSFYEGGRSGHAARAQRSLGVRVPWGGSCRLLGRTAQALACAAHDRRQSTLIKILSLVLGLSLVGCDGQGIGEPPSVTFDTLPGGAVHVSNSGAGVWSSTPGARWRVVEELRIGRREGSGPDVFGRVASVVVDELDRIWVVDASANRIQVFDPDGGFVRTVGRQGSGPGEFARIGPAFLGPDGEIWVEDLSLRRWERFDSTGTRVGGFRSTSRVLGALRLWTRDGRFLVVDRHPTDPDGAVFIEHRLVAHDSLDTVATLSFPEVQEPDLLTSETGNTRPVPFTPLPWMEVTPEGDIWVSHRLDQYMIRHQTLDGDTLRVIERAYDPVPVPDSTRQRAIAELDPSFAATDGFGAGRIPRAYPPFDAFHVSTDGTLWVRRTLAHGEAGFDVFANDGRYLGQPEVPVELGSMRIHLITSNQVYAVATDDIGLQYVVRLVIHRPGMD